MRRVLERARKWRYIDDNPVDGADRPAAEEAEVVALREQLYAMHTNFTRYLDVCDGKQVAEEAGGADGLG